MIFFVLLALQTVVIGIVIWSARVLSPKRAEFWDRPLIFSSHWLQPECKHPTYLVRLLIKNY